MRGQRSCRSDKARGIWPVTRQRTLVIRARIGEHLGLRPARAGSSAKCRSAPDYWRLRMVDFSLAVAELKIFSGPGQRDTEQICVVAHVGFLLLAQCHNEALHRDVLTRVLRSD